MDYKYINRSIESLIKGIIKQSPAIALTGPRQSGKSTVLTHIFPKISYVSLDDPLYREQAIEDPELFLDTVREPVIIDEIQYAPQLLSYIKIRIDQKRQKKGRFLLTGSQQFNLIKNIGDTLAGRIGLLQLLPFDLSEKMKIKHLTDTHKTVKKAFFHACLNGSYPEPNVNNSIDIRTWYGSYLQTYLERDIRSIYEIGLLREFQSCLKLLAANCAQVLNISTISKNIGTSVNTVKKWISILEASGIIYLLIPYYNNLGKRITKSPKLYFLDTGFVCYLTGILTEEHIVSGPMTGALFENYIIQEVVKTFLNRGQIPPIYYYRTHNGLEIDLIIEKNAITLIPVEIKFSQTPKRTMNKNIDAFMKYSKNKNIKNGKLVTLSEKEIILSKNISLTNVHTFLKMLNSI